MSEQPTPETNAARITEKNGCIATFGANQVVSVNFASKLERERDEAREDLRLFKHDKKHLCDSHRDKRGNCMVCSMEEAK